MAIDKTIRLKVDSKDAVKGIDQVEKGVKGVDKSAKGAKSGLGGMTGAAKGLGTAFKALGIGLIIAAFMKLKDIFSGNIETARRFERIAAQVSAAFDVLRDRAETFIKSLIALKNPFKAFKDAFKGTTAEIREEVKAIDTLTIALQGVRDEERDMLLIRAKANKIIAESRLLAEDETKTMQERLVALKEAIAEEKRVADMEVATQKKKVETLQAVIALGKSSETDMQELAAERARLIDLQTASVLKQKRVVTEIVTFEKQIETEKTKNAQAEKKRQEDEEKRKQKELDDLEKKIQKEKELADKKAEALGLEKEKELEVLRVAGLNQEELELDQARIKFEKLIALANKYGKDSTALQHQWDSKKAEITKKFKKVETKTIELSEKQKIDIVANTMGTLASVFGEESKAGKALAIGQTLISTYTAAAAALKPPPEGAGPIWGIPVAIGAVASGLANVAKIKSTKLPYGDSGGGGGGGSAAGSVPSMPTGIGGEGLIPNLEGISPTALGEPMPVQAYVVENDISNAQALQQELDVQATL